MKHLITILSLMTSFAFGEESTFQDKVYPLLKKSPIHLILFANFDFHPTNIHEHKDDKSHSITTLVSYSPDDKGSTTWTHHVTFHLTTNKEKEAVIASIEFRDTGSNRLCFLPNEVISVDGLGNMTKHKVTIDSQPALPLVKQMIQEKFQKLSKEAIYWSDNLLKEHPKILSGMSISTEQAKLIGFQVTTWPTLSPGDRMLLEYGKKLILFEVSAFDFSSKNGNINESLTAAWIIIEQEVTSTGSEVYRHEYKTTNAEGVSVRLAPAPEKIDEIIFSWRVDNQSEKVILDIPAGISYTLIRQEAVADLKPAQ